MRTSLCIGYSTTLAISQTLGRYYHVTGIGDTKMQAIFIEFMGLQSGETDQNVSNCNLVI